LNYIFNMSTPIHGGLPELVRKLDALGPKPSLIELARAAEATILSPADVAAYVQPNRQTYNRATVVFRDQYELLVMTWLPGQASVPHDHTGSICVMQVVQGEAVEGNYRVSGDGYVDLEYETLVKAGQVTAGQDAGIHTVRNPSQADEMLVTVHVYAPPLTDFRRFVPRGVPKANGPPAVLDSTPTIVVVGGGFSGSMAAAEVLRRAGCAGATVRVVLVERRGTIGEGLAYGTREGVHLLNVPAGRMSAWADRPDDFIEWARQRDGSVQPGDFLPRQSYGEYVRERLLETAHEAGDSARLSVVFDEVRRIARHPAGGWMVHLARGASLRAMAVVLAVGHRPPSDPIARKWSGLRTRFICDPWRPFAMNVIGADESVAVLGSGLTAVDTVLSLAEHTRRAPMTLISRRGLLPKAHSPTPMTPAKVESLVSKLLDSSRGISARVLLHEFRKTVDELAAAGHDWRTAIDGVRPHTSRLWRAMSSVERRRFLKHVRPFWEVHRHRMAVAVAERFQRLLAEGMLRVVAGRVESAQAEGDAVRLLVCERASDRLIVLPCDWVINCTGPVPSNSAESNPAIGSLLVDGWLRPDELALGVETTADGNAVAADAAEVGDLFVVGTLRKPALWESTAVPELRQQAATVAQHVIGLVRDRLGASTLVERSEAETSTRR
jgi:uncharacterized NAD(P)/FAD-binding protein YdhS